VLPEAPPPLSEGEAVSDVLDMAGEASGEATGGDVKASDRGWISENQRIGPDRLASFSKLGLIAGERPTARRRPPRGSPTEVAA